MNCFISYCSKHHSGDQACWKSKLWRTWRKEQFIQNFWLEAEWNVLRQIWEDNIKIILLIIYQVFYCIQLNHDNIQWSALTGVEKFRFLTLQIISSPSINCLVCASGRASIRLFSCLPYLPWSVRLREKTGWRRSRIMNLWGDGGQR